MSYDVDYSLHQIFDKTKKMEESRTSGLLAKFVVFCQLKLEETIELFEIIGDKSQDEKLKEIQRLRINEFISSLSFSQTLINWHLSYMSRSLQALNPQILYLLPKVLNILSKIIITNLIFLNLKLCKIGKVVTYDETIKLKLVAVRIITAVLSLDQKCHETLFNELKTVCLIIIK